MDGNITLNSESVYTILFSYERKSTTIKEQDKTRGEAILELEKKYLGEYADELNNQTKTLAKRGGGGYSKVAIGVMDAIYNDSGKWMVINVANNGTVRFLDDDAVIETACYVSKNGMKPLTIAHYPKAVIGLISAVKTYESLAVEAAITGNKKLALEALVAHPLVRDYDVANHF